MSSRVFRLLFAVLITFAALSSRFVTAQEVTSALAKVVSFPAANNVNELYVSIMGEVERPGTYRLTPSTLKLHSVVRCAHGFTANASTAIKIIRRGRASQTEIFSDKVDSPVLPGDLLLVESKRSNAIERNYSDVSAGRGPVTRADYSDAGRRPFVQVALLNVVDYPLVLRLHPDEANASYLVQALGQPIALLANTHVITPDVPCRQSSDAAKKAVQLQDGSIIVFGPGKIKKYRLPAVLPNPIDRETALATQFGLNHLTRSAKDLRQLNQDSYADQFDTLDPSHQRLGNLLAAPDGPFGPDADNQTENVTKLASLTSTPEIHDTDSQTDELTQGETESENGEDTLSMTIGSSLTTDGSIDDEQPKFSFMRVLVIFMIVGTLIGSALLLRRFAAVDSKEVNSTSEVIDVIQMSSALTPATNSRNPPKSLLELSAKGNSAKDHGANGVTSETVFQGEFTATTIAMPSRSEAKLNENVLQFEKSNSAAVAISNPSTSRPTAESPTIPFRIPNFSSAKPRIAASSEIPTEERNPSPPTNSQPAPLAKALFQLDRRRHS